VAMKAMATMANIFGNSGSNGKMKKG